MVDEADGGVVEDGRVGVEAGLVEVALPVVGQHDPAQLAVARDVEALVGREDDHAPRVLPPTDAVAAHHNLKSGTVSSQGADVTFNPVKIRIMSVSPITFRTYIF